MHISPIWKLNPRIALTIPLLEKIVCVTLLNVDLPLYYFLHDP